MRFEPRTVDLDGPVFYADFGGRGQPLVLVHGLGGSHLNWMAVGPGLTKHGRVVALDLAGFGLTRSHRRGVGLEDQRRLLHRFLVEVVGGEPTILFGNSMGGAIALAQAAAEPSTVSRLVLAAPAQPLVRARWEPEMASAVMAAVPGIGNLLLRRRAARGPEHMVRDLIARCVFDLDAVPPEMVEAHVALGVERAAWADDNRRDFTLAARSLAGLLLNRRRYAAMVRKVMAPTLVIQGNKDRLVQPEASEALVASRPDWRLRMFEDVGHVPQLEAPARFLAEFDAWLHARAEGAVSSSAER